MPSFFFFLPNFSCNVIMGALFGSRGVQTNPPTDPPSQLGQFENRPTGRRWRVGGGSPPPVPETGGSVDGSKHENLEKKTKKKTDPTVLHQKKSSFSIDGSISPVVLVRLVKKWPDLFEIWWDLIEFQLDLVEIRRDLIEIRLDLSISDLIWYRSSGFQQIPTKFCNFQPRPRTDQSPGRSDHPNRPLSLVGGRSRNGRPEVIGLVPGWAQTRLRPTYG